MSKQKNHNTNKEMEQHADVAVEDADQENQPLDGKDGTPELTLEDGQEAREQAAATQGKADAPVEVDEEPIQQQMLRLRADFDNYKKRMIKERSEFGMYATEKLIEGLLPVLDHYEMGLETARNHNIHQDVLQGFEMIYNQLLTELGKSGLSPIEALGQEFDPQVHECISHLPSPDVPHDKVMNQVRRGYRLHNKVLRATQVVVSSGKPE